MITPLLRLAFDPVHQRRRKVRRLRRIALSLSVAAIVAAAFLFAGIAVWRAALGALAAFALARVVLRRGMDPPEPDYADMARAIENRHPELHAMLLTVVQQRPDPATGKLHLLQIRLIADAVAASRRLDWVAAIPDAVLWRERIFACCGAALLAFALLRFGGLERLRNQGRNSAAPEPWVTVTPGDALLERGSGLIVLADFHRNAPGKATLIVQRATQAAQQIPLTRNLDDPVFGGGLPEVESDITYRIEYAGKATRDFTVKVYEHPRLDRADATLRFPAYTKLPEKALPDTRRVSAVEGAKLDVKFQLNKPVKSASLVAKDGTSVPLALSKDSAMATLSDFPVTASRTYDLKLEDADGRTNKGAAQFIVDALTNHPPELKFEWPKGDQRVSPIEEVAFRGHVWDDFGLSRYGITFNVAGHGDREILLGKGTRADEKRQFAHLLKLEDLGVKPTDLVSWYLWAEDSGPDGRTRRTEGDIYFAEVRPFEQIYRRDTGAGGEGDGSAGEGEGEAGKVSELQKQIISATWNLKRGEAADAGPEKPGAKYLKDEPVVRESQEDALRKAEKLAAGFDDPKLLGLAGNATQAMKSALDRLTAAASAPGVLSEALKAEEAAYDALLKLSEHEFSVRLSKSRGKVGGQQKQQLKQLEMEDDKQKYETKKEAEPMEKQQQREQLAILNRLKELAQRQQDVNQRLKELQNALQTARTEKERDEIRRQLKRLREEEQQLLADLDEMRQKMEQSAQQSQFAEDRSLEKTRAEAQNAAESMEKGESSQALASGVRAERDLQQMRDEFRKKTSGQFNEDAKEMRAAARGLAKSEEEIAEELKPKPEPAPGAKKQPTLDLGNEAEQLEDKLARQQTDLGRLTHKMQAVSEQAENVEPLLAKELYDALRKTTQSKTGDTLEKTLELTRLGNSPDAQKFEEKARKEIKDLKGGVERAAESVLGDEAEALRQARAELDKARDELKREIAQAQLRPAGSGAKPGQSADSPGETGNRPVEQLGKNDGGNGQPSNGSTAGGGGESDGGYNGGPLTGERFVEWSDRLRNIEEMVDDPAFRTDVARIREIAKGMRVEFKQHQMMPKWDLVKEKISEPLAELRNRLTEELARRESKESLVPIDRDPVPAQYADRVRRYYEELGRSR